MRGPAIAPALLTPGWLRARFAQVGQWRAELQGDRRPGVRPGPLRAAAVLVPLVAAEDGLRVLLTRRTDHLSDHAGQISFPGGRVEDGDGTPERAALREAQEEVGLAPGRVEVLGTLPRYLTITGYDVTPVVALVRPPLALHLDPFEVAEAFEVPLAFLMDPGNHERRVVPVDGAVRFVYAMPWQGERRYFIWGATAAMLRNLYAFLAEAAPP